MWRWCCYLISKLRHKIDSPPAQLPWFLGSISYHASRKLTQPHGGTTGRKTEAACRRPAPTCHEGKHVRVRAPSLSQTFRWMQPRFLTVTSNRASETPTLYGSWNDNTYPSYLIMHWIWSALWIMINRSHTLFFFSFGTVLLIHSPSSWNLVKVMFGVKLNSLRLNLMNTVHFG